MRIPTIRGIIDRRILVNYRVAPDVLTKLLPSPFRPKTYRGFGMVGICLIRLRETQPRFLPRWLGFSSENAAHRIAVEWNVAGTIRQGVYVPRRDTNSWMNSIAGGRLFPGIQHHARFEVRESSNHYELSLNSDDGVTHLSVSADRVFDLPETSIFDSLEDASAFYEAGSVGYSATTDSQTFQGIELKCHRWHVEPLSVSSVTSSYFDDRSTFPCGSIEFDCALLMRDIDHDWHGMEDLVVDSCASCDNSSSCVVQRDSRMPDRAGGFHVQEKTRGKANKEISHEEGHRKKSQFQESCHEKSVGGRRQKIQEDCGSSEGR